MNIYIALIVLISLSAAFAYINQRFFKLPFVIGLFVLSTALSILVISSKILVDNPEILKAPIVMKGDKIVAMTNPRDMLYFVK